MIFWVWATGFWWILGRSGLIFVVFWVSVVLTGFGGGSDWMVMVGRCWVNCGICVLVVVVVLLQVCASVWVCLCLCLCVSKEEEDDESDLVLQMRRERKKRRAKCEINKIIRYTSIVSMNIC